MTSCCNCHRCCDLEHAAAGACKHRPTMTLVLSAPLAQRKRGCARPRCWSSARAAWAARRRSTWPRRAWGAWASWTGTLPCSGPAMNTMHLVMRQHDVVGVAHSIMACSMCLAPLLMLLMMHQPQPWWLGWMQSMHSFNYCGQGRRRAEQPAPPDRAPGGGRWRAQGGLGGAGLPRAQLLHPGARTRGHVARLQARSAAGPLQGVTESGRSAHA